MLNSIKSVGISRQISENIMQMRRMSLAKLYENSLKFPKPIETEQINVINY